MKVQALQLLQANYYKARLICPQANKMSFNSFEYYSQLRQYQLHCQRLNNPQVTVPRHQAFSPPKIKQVRQHERNIKNEQIEKQNQIIMQKLVKINRRDQKYASAPTLSLPPIRREFVIPAHQRQNIIIAKKIIGTKSHVSVKDQVKRYQTIEQRRRNLSKFVKSGAGDIVNRRNYIAELMLMKKMRVSEMLDRQKNSQLNYRLEL